MRQLFFSFLLVVTSISTSVAQFSISDVLATARNEKAIQFQQQKMDYLKSNTVKLPWIDEVDVRTQTNDLDIHEQELTIRVRPNTKGEREQQDAIQQSNIEVNAVDEQILVGDFLKERYSLIVDVFHFQKLMKLKNEEIAIHQDKLSVMRRSMNLPKFNINNLISAEDEMQELEREILELEDVLNLSQSIIYEWLNKEISIPFELNENDLVDVDQVMQIARDLKFNSSESHTKLIKWQLGIEHVQRELELEKVEDRKWIDFFQARYGGRNNTEFREIFSLGLGLTIPLKKTEQLKINELELEKMVQENNLALIKEELEITMQRILADMESQYRMYLLIGSQIENSQAEIVLQQYQKIAGASPSAMLQLKGSGLKKQLELFKIRQSIYQSYIELLDVSGNMGQVPLKNYLSKGLEVF